MVALEATDLQNPVPGSSLNLPGIGYWNTLALAVAYCGRSNACQFPET